jgi:isochorismate hydrolase
VRKSLDTTPYLPYPTAIDAYQRDYEVLVASDCVASYDAEHDEVTRRYLESGIARFVLSAEIAKLLAPQ